MIVLVTGGLGFIGSAFVRLLINETDHAVVNVDKISYSSTEGSVAGATNSKRYCFQRCDLADRDAVQELVETVQPDAIVHLAAESHVDRSIDGPGAFLESNVVGTFNLLESARAVPGLRRFVHVSTDEVFGTLDISAAPFNEDTAYDPRSPYSATKAASDHLARAWGETYDLPVCVTNCSNNYGPYQFPEKMIPLMVIQAWHGQKLPVYGDGTNLRDWLHVSDHAWALLSVLERAEAGSSYLIGGGNQRTNLEVVHAVCDLVNEQVDDNLDRHELVEFVIDRPGHDFRYAVDSSKLQDELSWVPRFEFDDGLAETVSWYLANSWWWRPLWRRCEGARLGLSTAAASGRPPAPTTE
jgi:dTDP-glucose 4,6-dehydratase